MGSHTKFEKEMEHEACQKDCCSHAHGGEFSPSCFSNGCCLGDQEAVQDQQEVITVVDGSALVDCTFSIDGFDCSDCAAKLEKGIRRMKGVVDVKVKFSSAKMKVNYDKLLLQPADIIKAVSGFGYQATLINAPGNQQGLKTAVYSILGLDCADCSATLEKRIAGLDGVLSVNVNFATAKMTVEHTISDTTIIQVVQQTGYKAELEDKTGRKTQVKTVWWRNIRTQMTMMSGLILTVATILDWIGTNQDIVIPMYVVTAILGGYHVAKSGLYGLRSLSLDMNFLMTVAVIGAASIGEWSEGATVAFLFSFGNMLQTYTMDKTRQSIQALMELAPPEALVSRNGEELKLPVEEIVVGDIIIVKPGERIAMDGVVMNGSSAVNQATITGESIPVEKVVGDSVFSGTVNEHGVMEIEVTKISADSTLAKIMQLVEEAQDQKAPSQQLVDVFAKYYTPTVLLLATGIMVIPWLAFGEPFAPWFYKGLVLLVISCPCALVISTPVAIVSAIGNSSRQGVLIKGGAYLEQMGTIGAIAFDKTGTLTRGRPEVTDVVLMNGISENDFIVTAAAIERWSEHPLAAAIVKKATGFELKPVTKFKALIGRGAQADMDGQTIYIGKRRLFEELGHNLAQYEATLSNLENQGKTVMLMGTKESVYGGIAVADTLRDNSKEAVQALRDAGVKYIAMLTGDNNRAAGAIAKEIGLDAFYSELLPEDKVATVKKLSNEYGSVIMVGDGVNDAPAMAAADIGVAMGVAGSDTALETADIALMADDLGKLAYVIKLSRKTIAIIKQNIGFSIFIKIIFVILTFAGFVDLWLAVLADMGSSILVTLNGMRLMRLLR